MSVATDLTDAITPIVEGAGYRLWDLKITRAGKRSVVTVTIDKEGGPTLDGVADISKQIAPALDEHPNLENSYHLEVESPGLERPLTSPEHFKWSKNMEVAVSHRSDGTLTRTRGLLNEVSPSMIIVEDDGEKIAIEIESITKAHTIFDFTKAMKKDSTTPDQELDRQGEAANE